MTGLALLAMTANVSPLVLHRPATSHPPPPQPAASRDDDRSPPRAHAADPQAARIYLNKALQNDAARLKFDLASHIGHKVLHGGDGMKSDHATGGEIGESPDSGAAFRAGIEVKDVLLAWRDFECSFFAGALLCPKVPFRRFLTRERYRIEARRKLESRRR